MQQGDHGGNMKYIYSELRDNKDEIISIPGLKTPELPEEYYHALILGRKHKLGGEFSAGFLWGIYLWKCKVEGKKRTLIGFERFMLYYIDKTKDQHLPITPSK